jgi:hypothetical protein
VSAITFHPADLEPSRAYRRTYVTRLRRTRIDATVLICILICLLTLIPSNLIVPGMTDLARPALLVGFVLFFWWVLVQLTSHLAMLGPQPMRWMVLVFLIGILVSYAAGYLRSLTSIEANGADRMMMFFAILCGIILVLADGVPNWLRLQVILRVLVGCAVFMSLVALIEFALAIDVTKYLQIPGLSPKGFTSDFEIRGAGIRVASTTSHYIELAATLAIILPFAIHFALFGLDRRARQLGLLATILVTAGVLTTISRTGILAIALMLLVLIPVWTWRMRYNALCIGIGLLGMLTVAKPSMVVTLFQLFDQPDDNPAFTVREDRYPLVWHYFYQHPWLGRGTGTYIAPQYQILDNQWLSTLISNGIVGVATMAALHITAIVLASLALRRASNLADKHLCAAMVATQLIAIGVAGTFDSLSFSTYATVMALTIGMCATVWRLTHPHRAIRTAVPRWFLAPTRSS